MINNAQPGWLAADWPVPANVHAGTSTRQGGVSQPPYASLNLGEHVGDDVQAVRENRSHLQQLLALPASPAWLEQVHGVAVAQAELITSPVPADASYTDQPGVVCVVMTADCLPVLFYDAASNRIAAAHAGWRGLAAGVLEATLRDGGFDPASTLAWLGPGIGAESYEVGEEVREAFVSQPMHDKTSFRPSPKGRWLIDMYQLAKQRLMTVGVSQIYGGQYCSYQQDDLFYSYRRDGITGRMASLIWLTDPA